MQPIDANTTVRELLTAYPHTFEVFSAYGMCEDCKDNPPAKPIHQFALKHCSGNVAGLLAELNAVIQQQRK